MLAELGTWIERTVVEAFQFTKVSKNKYRTIVRHSAKVVQNVESRYVQVSWKL